jgi:hypothetical protein
MYKITENIIDGVIVYKNNIIPITIANLFVFIISLIFIFYSAAFVPGKEEPVAKGVIETNPDLTYIKLTSGFNVSEEDVCVAIAVKKGSSDLQSKINEVLGNISETERNELMNQAIARNAE